MFTYSSGSTRYVHWQVGYCDEVYVGKFSIKTSLQHHVQLMPAPYYIITLNDPSTFVKRS